MKKTNEEFLEKAKKTLLDLIKEQEDGKTYMGKANGAVLLDRNDPSDVEWYEDDSCISEDIERSVKQSMEYYQKVDAGIEPRRSARDGLEEIKRKLIINTKHTQTIINNEQAKEIANLPITEVKETKSIKVIKMNKKDSQERIERQIEKWK